MQIIKYTQSEMKEIMDSVDFPKGLKINQSFRVLLWAIFNKNKLYRFCWNIERGMYITFAFKDADNNLKIN